MSELFDDLCEGLQQAIDFEKGKGKARVKTYVLSPVRHFDKGEIRNVRMAAGMTQSVFADFMGVSKKTVEAWECGRTHPTGSACRLMEVLSEHGEGSIPFVKASILVRQSDNDEEPLRRVSFLKMSTNCP